MLEKEQISELVTLITNAAHGQNRVLVAIVGAPASGKSTLAENLAAALPNAEVLPMDGFHLDNATLERIGLLHRKGAPATFDASAFLELLKRVTQGGAVLVPTFDRASDRVIPDGARIKADTRIVLVEGNYLLLDAPVWREMHALWDLSIYLKVPQPELERRLVQRWLDHGLTPDDATRRAQQNDLPNARTVRDLSIAADVTLTHLSNA